MILAQVRQVSGNFGEKILILYHLIVVQADQDLSFQEIGQNHGNIADGAVTFQGQKINPGLFAPVAQKILQKRQVGRAKQHHRIGEGRGGQELHQPGLHGGAEFRTRGGGHHSHGHYPRLH